MVIVVAVTVGKVFRTGAIKRRCRKTSVCELD